MTATAMKQLGAAKLELGPARESTEPWQLVRDERDIAWLILDDPDASTNTISLDTLSGLAEKIDEIETDMPRALVLRSGKSSGFIAGADIGEFVSVGQNGESQSSIMEQLRSGHRTLDRLEALACPTIAVVHGYALGAGFELALAVDYRIAIDGAWFGFPEVQLGLHPGLGGTFRLPELIDPVEAMSMMLSGKSAYTRKAQKLGIADVVTEERHVRSAVHTLVESGERSSHAGLKDRALDLDVVRAMAARQMRSKTEKKAPSEHYPAPHALIDLWEQHGDNRAASQDGEIESFANLLGTDTAQNLIRAFHLRQHLKSLADGRSDINHLHVVGAGVMGGSIAAWCAIKGMKVTLFDTDEEALGRAVARAGQLCDAEHLSTLEKRDAMDRLIPDPRAYGVGSCDLVIEAGPEDVELKRQIYDKLEGQMREEAILATNTSSLSLQEIGRDLKRPERFVGLHFFNPVAKMQLVEVVCHAKSDQTAADAVRAFAGAISRLPVPVTDYPGFLVNRALTPYLLEAMLMVEEGKEKELVDACAERFGMPVGPVELADRVGLDVCLSAAHSLQQRLSGSIPQIPDWVQALVDNGDTGEKSGKGLYTWKDGKPQKRKTEGQFERDMEDRLILPMLNACMECLREDVVADEKTLDSAMIFGTGFAPFRGGPMKYAQTLGYERIAETLATFAKRYGDRFSPDEGWQHASRSSATA